MASALQVTNSSSAPGADLHRNAKQNIEAFSHMNRHSIIEGLGINNSDVEKIAPCTPLQEGIIYHFLNSGRALYCSSFSFEFHTPCDFSRLESAWLQAQKETQMLRARLSPTPDGYAQVILKNCELPVSEVRVDSDNEIGEVRESKFKAWTVTLDDLSKDLWEVWLISSQNKSVMCLNIFHALYDGNSLSLLLEKVARKYLREDQNTEEESPFLDTLPMGPLCKDPSAEPFWTDHLKDSRQESVPKSNSTDHPSIVKQVNINAIQLVDKFRKSLNVTEQAVLHACWLLTLQHQFRLVPQIGMVVSGRALDIPGIENVIGPLFNTIPSNINFNGLRTREDLVQRCHSYHISTIPFQHTPLRDIMKWTKRSPHDPLFDSLFVFQRFDNENKLSGRKLWSELDSEADHEYPLAFEITRNENVSFTATIAIQDHVMSSAMAQETLTTFERLLYELLHDPTKELPHTTAITDTRKVENQFPTGVAKNNQDQSFQWTPVAASIRDVIADLASVDQQSVGVGTSIFELGLDSIDAIKLSSRLRKRGIQLAVSVIMRHRTIREMMEQLTSPKRAVQNGGRSSVGRLEQELTEFLRKEAQLPNDACRILPATPIQEAMVAEMIASDYAHYYNHDVLELEAHVDVVKLVDAWKAIVNANPVLRTSFVEVWDPKIPVSYAQVVHRGGSIDVQMVDLHGQSMDILIQNQRTRAASDLAQRPLLTISVVVDKCKRYLVLSMAHSLYDGWSMDMLHEDVAKAYAGNDCQRPPYDEVLEHIIASSGKSASKFWRATLANFVPTPFPQGQQAGNDELAIHRDEKTFSFLPGEVDRFCKLNGVTMQALCVTCWALVLAGYIGKLDVAFGLVLSGRNTADSQHVMFPTMNTVAMRAILHGSLLEMVKYIQGTLVDMTEHQHFPLRKARPDIGSRNLFDSLFIYQKRHSESTAQAPALYKSTGGSSAIEFPVCVEMESAREKVACRVACRDNVLGAMDCAGLLERMEQVLSSILHEPHQQTVEFADEATRICGRLVSHGPSPNGVAHDHIDSSSGSKTEWSCLENQIRQVLSIVSDTPEGEIDKETTLFQLGLDSISAIKVSSLLKKQSIRLAVSEMLKAGTVENMALAVNRSSTELTSDDIRAALERLLVGIDIGPLLQSCRIDSEQVERVLPVTAGQSYFLSMNALNPDVFYPTFCYLASENLSRTRLDEAWDRLTEVMPMLRTAFVPTNLNDLPFIQVVMKSVHGPVVWHHGLQGQESGKYPQREIHSVPATLHAAPTRKGTALMLQIHHALYDAVSLSKIMETLAAIYNTGEVQSLGTQAHLASYIAFHSIHSPIKIRRQFWENYMGKNHDKKAPSSSGNFRGAIERWYRPGLVSNMSKVEATAKRENLSFQAIFLAIYARVHDQICGDDASRSNRKAIGLYLANRSHAMEGLPDLLAPTVNIVPLRIDDKHGERPLFEYARQIQNEINEISRIEHSGVSLQEISDWTGVQLDTCINFMRFPEIVEENDHQTNGSHVLQIKPATAEDLHGLGGEGEDKGQPPKSNGVATPNGTAYDIASQANGGQFTNVFKVCGYRWPKRKRDDDDDDDNDELTRCKPTLDVEAAIREDKLDFGVFGLADRLRGRLAEKVIGEVQEAMMELVRQCM